MQKDLIGFAGGDTNLYRYVGNDSVNYIDPNGKAAFLAAIGAGALVGGVTGLVGDLVFNNNSNFKSARNAFLGGAALGATTVLTAGSNIVAAAGVSLVRAGASIFTGLVVGAAVNLATTPEAIPQAPLRLNPEKRINDSIDKCE